LVFFVRLQDSEIVPFRSSKRLVNWNCRFANTPVNGLLGRQVLVTPIAGSVTSDVRRTLNPAFVEALMGWPTGWTGFASVATAWSPWLRRMRCELSRLNCWPMDDAAA
jgi:DNA (cytosine-5)-methyltransferase 1